MRWRELRASVKSPAQLRGLERGREDGIVSLGQFLQYDWRRELRMRERGAVAADCGPAGIITEQAYERALQRAHFRPRDETCVAGRHFAADADLIRQDDGNSERHRFNHGN